MRNKQLKILFISLAAIAVIIIAAIVIISNHQASDPYVTKKYVDETVKQSILNDATEEINEKANEVENSFLNTINSKDGSYRSVEMEDGQSIKLASNCEIVVVSGNLSFNDGGSLTDISAGKIVSEKSKLSSNHSYIANDDGVTLNTSGTTEILIKGTAVITD